MSDWNWKPARMDGIWHGSGHWCRPLVALAPWLSVGLVLLLFLYLGQSWTAAKGVLFDLPEAAIEDAEATDFVALVLPKDHDTLVFFDDARYLLGDATSLSALTDHLAALVPHRAQKTSASMLLLVDRRVSNGDIMKLAAQLKKAGIMRTLLATRKVTNEE